MGRVAAEGDWDGGRDIDRGTEGLEGAAETGRGGRGAEEVERGREEPEERAGGTGVGIEGRGERGTDEPEERTIAGARGEGRGERGTDEPEERTAAGGEGREGSGPEDIKGRGERGTDGPEERTAGGGGGGRGGRGLSVVTRTEEDNGISSGSNSEIMEGEPIEPGRGTPSGKSSERTDAATKGGKICTKGLVGVLVEGE